MRAHCAAAALLAVTAMLPTQTSAQPMALCRGSTRAHVHIHWPTPNDLAQVQATHWGSHIPERIRRWAYLFVPKAKQQRLDPYLVAAVMRIESNGDPLVWNLDSDARGLMQVLHASWEPGVNIPLGVSMLGSLQRQFSSRDLVLAGYNAGPGAVQQYGGIPPYPETRDYVVLVDFWRDAYAGEHLSPARVQRYQAALADLRAFHKRECGAF